MHTPKYPYDPPFILKNNHIYNHIKKAYLQVWKYLYNPFYSNNFFKSNNTHKKYTHKPQTQL